MTITTLRPNANKTVDSQVSFHVGSSVWSVLQDNLDTTWDFITPSAARGSYTAAVHLTTVVLTATQRVYGITTRARMSAATITGETRTVDVSLKYATDMTVAQVGKWSATSTTTVAKTQTGVSAATKPGGGEWDQAHLDAAVYNAVLHQVYSPSIVGNDGPNLYEAYADVDIRNQPTVTGQASSGFTNNSQPTFTWGVSDADNATPTYYWVRVFDAATVAAPDFNPTTSAAAWESGVVQSMETAVTSGPLQNGVTYTTYVRVAKDFPLKNSDQLSKWQEANADYKWWSPWAATSAFTVTFTPPYAPVIQSATVLPDTNQYRAQLQVQTAVNLLSADAASLETTIGEWKSLANCTVSRTTAQAADGTASLLVSGAASGAMTAYVDGQGTTAGPRIIVDYGQTYTALASFRSAVTARTVQVGVRWHFADGTTGSSILGTGATDSTSGWTQVSYTGTAPAGANFGDLVVSVSGAVANEVHYVDKASFAAGSSTTWMPGGYLDSAGDLLVERCEFMDDARGPMGNMLCLQVSSAGSQARTADGFSYFTTTTAKVSPLLWMWLNKTIPVAGDTPAGMIRWLPALASNSEQLEISNKQTGSPTSSGTDYNVPVVTGQQYTFSCWAWVDTGTLQVTPSISWRDSTGNTVVSSSSGSVVTLTTAPQQIVVTGACPAGAVLASGRLTNTGASNTQHVFVTRCGFGTGTVAVDSQRGLGSAQGTWLPIRYVGAANNSLILTDARFLNPALPPGPFSGQVETVSDYEYPPGRTVLYRASISYALANGTVIASPYSTVVAVYGAPPSVTLLRSVTDPTLQVAVNRRRQMTFTVTEDAQIFHPLGADAAPVKVRDWVGGEDGQLIVVLSSDAQYRRLSDLLRSSNVMLVQWAQGGRTYALINDRNVDETISSDTQFCDADGSHAWMAFRVATLGYLETSMP